VRKYEALPWQFCGDHAWRELTVKPLNYAIFGRIRLFHTFRFMWKYFFLYSNEPKILDIGIFPGTIHCILAELLPKYGLTPQLFGAGLNLKQDFKDMLEKRCNTRIDIVNMDPDNKDLKQKNYKTIMQHEDNSMDIVIATEIIEHLTNPNHMLSEAHRVLKKAGAILITTPNVTRIGSIFKLLVGRSNLDVLTPIGYSNQDDEWRPHFREYSMNELKELLSIHGFDVKEYEFYNDCLDFVKKDIKQRFVDLAKIPFGIAPHLRGCSQIIAIKK
jgi:SAM-dependent methyltransferase